MITLIFFIVLVIVYNLTSAQYNGSFFYIIFTIFFGKKTWNPFCSDSLLWIALKFSTHNIRVGNHNEIERYLQYFDLLILNQFSCKQCFGVFFFFSPAKAVGETKQAFPDVRLSVRTKNLAENWFSTQKIDILEKFC
jgi:hypothetical protein